MQESILVPCRFDATALIPEILGIGVVARKAASAAGQAGHGGSQISGRSVGR